MEGGKWKRRWPPPSPFRQKRERGRDGPALLHAKVHRRRWRFPSLPFPGRSVCLPRVRMRPAGGTKSRRGPPMLFHYPLHLHDFVKSLHCSASNLQNIPPHSSSFNGCAVPSTYPRFNPPHATHVNCLKALHVTVQHFDYLLPTTMSRS